MNRTRNRRALALALLAAPLALVALSSPAEAYVGPGAGFALATSLFVVLGAVALAGIYLAIWPIRLAWRTLLGRRAFKDAKTKRVVILGLDGLDVRLAERYMAEGRMPNLQKLNFVPLATTLPALSPVAWSTFQTGLDPAGHGLFDFLRPARPHYMAELSSVTTTAPARMLKLGRFKIPLGKPKTRLRRRGVPFWKILGKQGIFSAVVRVPITFPPEKFRGVSLSGMCVPDIRGTQGTFTEFCDASGPDASEGGVRVPVTVNGDRVEAVLTGPPNPLTDKHESLTQPFSVAIDRAAGTVDVTIDGETERLKDGLHSEWMEVTFKAGLSVKIKGIVRFALVSLDPFRLYASPVHFNPEKPAQPISNPPAYAVYLGKRFGPCATLGLAEDTWALNERVIDSAQFLEGSYKIHAEREKHFFDALEKVRKGLVVCVFDGSDRIQHMFFRTLSDDHPANRGRRLDEYRDVIPDMYQKMDDLVGRTVAKLKKDDTLLVMSDHGFRNFSRGINLNAWLRQEGFLVMKEGHEGGQWYEGVDWSKTTAYALGLSGIFLNRKGREQHGIVGDKLASELIRAIKDKLAELRDPERPDYVPIRRTFGPAEIPPGPYADEAPEIMVGYNDDYRISWDGAVGDTRGPVFEDNVKAWSGDHCVDPALAPGVLYSNRKFTADQANIRDLAPTTLDLFGVPAPAVMKGRRLFGDNDKPPSPTPGDDYFTMARDDAASEPTPAVAREGSRDDA